MTELGSLIEQLTIAWNAAKQGRDPTLQFVMTVKGMPGGDRVCAIVIAGDSADARARAAKALIG